MNTTATYRVMVDDNFDFYDEDGRYCAGTYNSLEDALQKCLLIVGQYMLKEKYPTMEADEIYRSYNSFGDDPFIQGPAQVKFSAWEYAKALANVMAGKAAEDGPRIEQRFRLAYLGALMLEAKDREAGE